MIQFSSVRLLKDRSHIGALALGVAFICVALTLILEMGLNPSSGDGPRQEARRAGGLVCEKAIWNFGVVDVTGVGKASKNLSHDYVLTNESQEVVRIREVKASCGCMVASGYKQTLPPGESTRVKLSVTLPPTPGPFQKKLVAAGRDPRGRLACATRAACRGSHRLESQSLLHSDSSQLWQYPTGADKRTLAPGTSL